MTNNAPIGIFDSGVGGLTVVKEVMSQLPNESIIYFGDTARVPYGSKSKETILTYSRQIVSFLLSKKVKAIVIACNTATAFSLDIIKKEISVPIIGVIEPGAYTAYKTTKNNKIGITGTYGTVNSGIYTDYIKKLNKDIEVYSNACPLFVPLVEEGMIDDPVTIEMIRRYMKPLIEKGIDSLILGCTHYPLLQNTIKSVLKKDNVDINLVNPAYETAKELKNTLTKYHILNEENKCKHSFYVSDGAEKFKSFANTIIPCEVIETNEINNIEQYFN